MAHDHRHWILVSPSDLPNIDYSEICETSIATTTINLAGDTAFIKWDGPSMPPSVAALPHLSEVLTHEQIKSELSTGWSLEIENIT